jgi:ATP-dependent Clp protease ATP-binding subunit ClpA
MNNNYQSNNMDTQTLASIAKSSITYIESSIGALNNLMENLKIFKQAMIDCINIQAESADANYPVTTFTQSHTLPGVTSIQQRIKSNDEKMEQLKDNKEKALRQKRIFLRLVEKDSKLFSQSLKGIQLSDASFEEFIEILNNNIDLSLQPSRVYDNPARMKPNIKLSVTQDFDN